MSFCNPFEEIGLYRKSNENIWSVLSRERVRFEKSHSGCFVKNDCEGGSEKTWMNEDQSNPSTIACTWVIVIVVMMAIGGGEWLIDFTDIEAKLMS